MTMREEHRARRYAEGQARLNLQQGELSGRKVITVKDLSFAYPDQPPLIEHFSTQIMRGDRTGVIGPNGSGKTTLLKLLTAQLVPTQGELLMGTKL